MAYDATERSTPPQAIRREDSGIQSRVGVLDGVVVDDRYRLGPRLGAGGAAVVHDALDTTTDQRVALKVLHLAFEPGSEGARRFRREVRLMASVRHPGVVRILDAGEMPDGRAYLVMERLLGRTLRMLLRQRGPLRIGETFYVGSQLFAALDAIHRAGIVHRDVKPGNVFLCAQRGAAQVKLLDFGLAKGVDDSSLLTPHGRALGSPSYMAPEQILAERVDARTDQYALAVCLYEMLTGTPPFGTGRGNVATVLSAVLFQEPEPPSARQPDLPRAIDGVLLRALARRSEERYRTLEDFWDAFEAALR